MHADNHLTARELAGGLGLFGLVIGLIALLHLPAPPFDWPLWLMCGGSLLWLVCTEGEPKGAEHDRPRLRPLTLPALLVLLVLGIAAAAQTWGAVAAWVIGVLAAVCWLDVLLVWHNVRELPRERRTHPSQWSGRN